MGFRSAASSLFGEWTGVTEERRAIRSDRSSAHCVSQQQAIETKEQNNQAPSEYASDEQVELSAMAKVLAVLERQLVDVNIDIENSIVGIAKGFSGMAQRAQAAVHAVGTVVGDDVESSKIGDMQNVVCQLVAHINDSCSSLTTAADRLSTVEQRLDGVEAVLTGIEELALRSRLVALNGEIEAGRLGSLGAAFGVVASETKLLSQHAGETSGRAQTLLSELSQDIRTTNTELRQKSGADATRLSESHQQAEAVLGFIETQHAQLLATLREAAGISRELQQDIAKAVVSLQFQDRVSQRLQHVVNGLKLVHARAQQHATGQCDASAERRSQEILGVLASDCTMESERQMLTGQSETGSDSDCEVELF